MRLSRKVLGSRLSQALSRLLTVGLHSCVGDGGVDGTFWWRGVQLDLHDVVLRIAEKETGEEVVSRIDRSAKTPRYTERERARGR